MKTNFKMTAMFTTIPAVVVLSLLLAASPVPAGAR